MLEQYYRINQAAGVSIVINDDESSYVSACGIIAKNKQLDIDKKIVGLKSIKELNQQLPLKTIVALNLAGKGILYKQISKTEFIDQSNFNLVFPNAKIDDFYVQNFISNEFSFVALIRRNEADKYIQKLKDAGYITLTLSLGPFPVDHIIGQLNFYENEFQFDGHHIKLGEKKTWADYKYDPRYAASFPIKIEQETINEKAVMAYAVAFQLVLSLQLPSIKADVHTLQTTFVKTIAQLKLKAQGFAILAVFFLLLLINFIAFSSLNSDNNKKSIQVSRLTQSSTDLAQISEQVKKKEGLLLALGWDGGINKSSLIDQLASLLPPEVKWTSVDINPLDIATSRLEKAPLFSKRRLKIIGSSEKIIPVNEWIARVKTKAWVKDIQLENYVYDNELNTGIFTITINY